MSLLVARRGLLAAGAAPTEEPPPSGDYAAEVAADSPDWWLRLEETSGATVSDEVGTNDGTVTGANLDVASFADTGSAASFDGTDDKIVVSDTATLEMTNAGEFAVEALVRVTDPTADAFQFIADKSDSSFNNNQWGLWWDNRSSQGSPLRLRFLVSATSSGASGVDVEGTGIRDQLAAGCHIVALKLSDRTQIWVNGVMEAERTGQTFNLATNNLDVGIATGSTGWAYLGGIMDEPAFYSSALSSARISAHASAAGLGS